MTDENNKNKQEKTEEKSAENAPAAAAQESPEASQPLKSAQEPESAPVVEDAQKVTEQETMAAEQKAEEALKGEEVKPLDLRPGMTIRVFQKIKEGEKERVQMFQGIITALRGKTPETKTITVQKQSFGVFVEKIFPLASPLIEKIEVVKVAKVRRAKLNFLQGYGKRLKEAFVKP